MTAALPLPLHLSARSAGICSDHRLVLAFLGAPKMRQHYGLQIHSGPSSASQPIVSGATRNAGKCRHYVGGGEVGNLLVECHDSNRSLQIKIRNAENASCQCPHCGHIKSMEAITILRCPRCHAAEHEAEVPGVYFDCGSGISHSSQYPNLTCVGVGCHIPNPDSSISSLYEHEVSQWRWRKSTVIAKEILSWEKHMQRHSQAYAIGGASKTPPGVLPDGDKLSALKEALKEAKDREDYNALLETHFLPATTGNRSHSTRRRVR